MSAAPTTSPATASDPESRLVVRAPATGAPLGEVAIDDAATVRAKVAAARAAQQQWAHTPLAERARRVLGFRDVLVRSARELSAALERENGKTRVEALAMELTPSIDAITYFARRAEKLLAPQPIPLHLYKHRKSYLHFVPRGVVGIISAWNFPLSIPTIEAAMAALAGNAAVVKPSEVTPLVMLEVKRLWDASGLPPDLLQVVNGRGATGAALVEAGIDMCIFTGSTATGRRVAAACGERLIPCVLELGGKAPAIVCADADLERTANALVWGAFANSGQVCASVERVYVHSSVHDELVSRILDKTRKLRQGDPSGPGGGDVDVGAMTWDRQLAHVEELVARAQAAGAKILLGGRRRPGAGQFYEPTVLTDCKQDMDIMRREIFGPVLPIMKVDSEEQALSLANDSQLGLLGYVFSRDKKKGRRLAERLEAGTVMVNDVLATFGAPETPWAGIKQSGLGRTHSDDGLRDMCQTRHVNHDRLALARDPWWYPYSQKVFERSLKLLRLLYRPR